MLARLGIDTSGERFDGIDLSPWIADPLLPPPDRALALEAWYVWLQYGFAPLEGCTQGPLKYLRSCRDELFDRSADPREQHDLFTPDDPRVTGLRRRLAALQAAGALHARENPALSEADRTALGSLGYAQGGGNAEAPAGDWSELADPYAKLPVYAGFDAVSMLLEKADYTGAIAKLRELVLLEPGSALFHEQLGMMLINVGAEDAAEAEKELEKTLALDPRRARVWFALARCVVARRDAARRELRAARERGDKTEQRRFGKAERELATRTEQLLRECLRLEPTYPDGLMFLGQFLAEEGDRAAAQKDPARARSCYAQVQELLARLAVTLERDDPDQKELATIQARCEARIAALGQE